MELMDKYKGKGWVTIAQELNKLSQATIRTSKQCREHWKNYLNPNIRK